MLERGFQLGDFGSRERSQGGEVVLFGYVEFRGAVLPGCLAGDGVVGEGDVEVQVCEVDGVDLVVC